MIWNMWRVFITCDRHSTCRCKGLRNVSSEICRFGVNRELTIGAEYINFMKHYEFHSKESIKCNLLHEAKVYETFTVWKWEHLNVLASCMFQNILWCTERDRRHCMSRFVAQTTDVQCKICKHVKLMRN